ncbi:MAG: YebC/PmpR family DNA-binding transcriptional regulator [Planctomycetota bacterium]|nr:YebC/PmpR family DNA-binding transcriptional regulator [Planctomycetota bacterium]
MAKHNKWSKVKHRKAAVEKKRGKIWTKIAKAIIVAAKNGGPDPASNLTLRYAIDEARYANMPRDTIERAIKKGAGGESTESYEAMRYEGYAPGGVAVIVDALTDNRTRTITDVRLAFSDHNGNVGTTGCVAFLFQHRGEIVLAGNGKPVDADKLMELALESGAEDVQEPDGPPEGESEELWTILTDPTKFQTAKDAFEQAGYKVLQAELAMIPETRVSVAGEAAEQLAELVERLEDLDDVQKVWTNADFADAEADV